VDDNLITGTLDLTYTSQITVVAGVEKFSNPASRGTVVNFVGDGIRNFSLEVPRAGGTDPDRIMIGLSNTPLATIQNAGLAPGEKDEV
jgi:hypothetical protein